jgi:ketosteroid isomerase-like protein
MTSIIRLCSLLAAILAFVPINAIAQSSDPDTGQKAMSGDEVQLTAMLHDFLGSSGQRKAHVSFWADDLVYTSSTGQRFGKAEILSGFDKPDNEEDTGPAMAYTGEDVKVQVFGTTAIVTFKLVGTPDDGSAVKNYFNTGTFLKRGGEWRAVAWQATVIPDT